MRKTPTQHSKSKSKNLFHQNKPSLANLMNHYKSDEGYNVKLNMNHQNPQIIQTNSYQLSRQAQQSRRTWKQKDPFKDLVIMNNKGSRDRRDNSQSSQNSSYHRFNHLTPKRGKINNLLNYQSNYLISEPSNKDSSREGYGLFRQIIKKQSKENSIVQNNQYYDLIEKKANQIKEQNKKMLKKCHSNGTLSSAIETMKANTHKQIDEYARRILDDKDNLSISQTKIQSKSESRVSENVGSAGGSQNNSVFNNQFSFQIDTFQLDSNPFNTKQTSKEQQQDIFFDYFGQQVSNIQKDKLNTNEQKSSQRPFSKISHSNHNYSSHQPVVSKLTTPIASHHQSPKVETPVNRFLTPQSATIFTQIQIKPHNELESNGQRNRNDRKSVVQFVPIVRKNSVNNKDKWIKIQRPQNVDYLENALNKSPNGINIDNKDFLKTNNFNYPFENIWQA